MGSALVIVLRTLIIFLTCVVFLDKYSVIFYISVKTQQQVLALDKENKQMKQTLTYLQQELIKSGKKNVAQGLEKGPNQGIS